VTRTVSRDVRKGLLLLIATSVAVAGMLACRGPAGAATESRGAAPPGFLNVVPQTAMTGEQATLLQQAGVRTIRAPLYWMSVEPDPPWFASPDWSGFDGLVRVAAAHDMSVLPFLWGSPDWAAARPEVEPAANSFARSNWRKFLRLAVRRYGPGGEFWRENPTLPQHPIRVWQIWNEPNIVTFARPASPTLYGRLVRISGNSIHSVDPKATVLLAGLFGRPLFVPPNVPSSRFLDQMYRVPGVASGFDAVALHPYVVHAGAIRPEVRALRRVLRRHGDAHKRLWVTEMGWGSDSFESRWERGYRGQARELNRAMRLLSGHRKRWRIERVFWFTVVDAPHRCQFCDSAGLLSRTGQRKPAWFAFNRWTGGDPGSAAQAVAALP
jgi:polysaccharide biosynthesis protein PslG